MGGGASAIPGLGDMMKDPTKPDVTDIPASDPNVKPWSETVGQSPINTMLMGKKKKGAFGGTDFGSLFPNGTGM